MKTLIITAHPSKKGFTHAIANMFAESSNDAEIINLYKEKPQKFLTFEDKSEIKADDQVKSYQKKIIESDKIVFVHPIWWGSVPAIMKNFCDTVLLSGFAYKYVKWKTMPEGLLKGKDAYVFMTADGPSFLYSFIFTNPKKFWTWMFGMLPFCGMKVKHLEVFGGMRKSTLEMRENRLDKVAKIAKED